MNKQLLVDYIVFNDAQVSLILEGKSPNGRMRLKGKLSEAEVKNGNGRVYPKEVLLREFNKFIEGPVKNRTSLGELDHPDSSVINLQNVSHLITRVWWEDNNVMGELELLNTPSGKIAQELILANIPLGISTRAMGSVKQIGETVEVQDDLELLTADLVSTPSANQAYMTLAESKAYNSIINKYSRVNELITEIICSQTGVCALC